MTSRGKSRTQTRGARSSSLDGSVCTVSSTSSIPSIPSIDVSSSVESATEWEHSRSIPSEVKVDAGEDANRKEEEEHPTATVGVDHERQVLLLFLLAQVAALHDPTPRTFTYVDLSRDHKEYRI